MNWMKILLLPCMLGMSYAATPDFSMIGFATTDGGTTGGAGGAIVTPTTLAELKTYAEDKTTPYIIRITQEFNSGISVYIDTGGTIASSGTLTTYGDIIRLGSNKTLVGIGTSAFFNRLGIVMQSQSNIIIRNIRFTMKNVPIAKTDENKIVGLVNGVATPISDPDCIGMQADDTTIAVANRKTHHVWIDHCEFFNEDPSVMTNKDRYDGLIDAKNFSTDFTVSWCYFHDHHKASLLGKSNTDDYDRHITYHHNYFRNIASRLPLARFGKIHLLNNYMITSSDGADARINSDLYIEGNYFKDASKPVFGKVSENGAATFVGNSWINCNRVPQVVLDAGESVGSDPLDTSEEVLAGTFVPSTFYSYSSLVTSSANVPVLDSTWSGIGKISTSEYDPRTSSSAAASSSVASSSSVAVSSSAASSSSKASSASVTSIHTGNASVLIFALVHNGQLTLKASQGTPLRLVNILGLPLYSGYASGNDQTIATHLSKGIVILQSGSQTQQIIVP